MPQPVVLIENATMSINPLTNQSMLSISLHFTDTHILGQFPLATYDTIEKVIKEMSDKIELDKINLESLKKRFIISQNALR